MDDFQTRYEGHRTAHPVGHGDEERCASGLSTKCPRPRTQQRPLAGPPLPKGRRPLCDYQALLEARGIVGSINRRGNR